MKFILFLIFCIVHLSALPCQRVFFLDSKNEPFHTSLKDQFNSDKSSELNKKQATKSTYLDLNEVSEKVWSANPLEKSTVISEGQLLNKDMKPSATSDFIRRGDEFQERVMRKSGELNKPRRRN